MLLKACGVLAFIAGALGLWYGFAMSFLVPGAPGEPYFQKNRMLLGNVPLLASLLMLSAAGWLFLRSVTRPKLTLGQAITYCVGSAAGLGFVFAVIGALIYQR
jgi:hypothetical protein